MTTLAQFLGVLAAAFAAEFLRRLAARQKKVGKVIDWIAETLDEPNAGKSLRPRPIASTHVDDAERVEPMRPRSDPPKDAA